MADRHLKVKTDAIAHIIRNIAEQCQAAVEGLQLAHDAEHTSSLASGASGNSSSVLSARRDSNISTVHSDDGHSAATSEVGDESHMSMMMLHPSSGRTSSIPPTPDLIPNRSSTSMSIASSSTTTPERSSQQYVVGHDVPTKIVEDDEDDLTAGASETEIMSSEPGVIGKHAESLIHRPSGARISALGGTR